MRRHLSAVRLMKMQQMVFSYRVSLAVLESRISMKSRGGNGKKVKRVPEKNRKQNQQWSTDL